MGKNAVTFVDNFYVMDPYAPPPAGTTLTAVNFTVEDEKGIGQINGKDSINGSDIQAVYPGDTVTVQYANGSMQTITGVTFYLENGQQVFSPTDGSTLQNATFVSSTWTTVNSSVTSAQMQLTCFTPGVRLKTPQGQRAIETLKVGDMVKTLDNGAQAIRWIGRRRVEGQGEFAPIRFMKGAIGNRRALRVSPQHRMLISGWRAELMFAESELLVAAKYLVNGDTIHATPCGPVDYIHLMFDRHEVIFAEGIATESFCPGDHVLGQDRALMAELTTLFPDLCVAAGRNWQTARRVLKAHEAVLVA